VGKRILSIGTTNHRISINKQLSDFATSFLQDVEADHVDMIPYEMPLFGSDRQEEEGIPERANQFRDMMSIYDGFIVGLAEHNGAYTAVFKNLIDWLSVMEGKVWQQKPVFLMSASPGPRGAISVLGMAENYFPHMGAKVTGTYSLGGFNENFDALKGVVNDEKLEELKEKVAEFETAVLEAR